MRPMTDTDTTFGTSSSQGAPEGHYLHVPMMYMATLTWPLHDFHIRCGLVAEDKFD